VAVTEVELLAELVAIVDRRGGFANDVPGAALEDQHVLVKARTLVAIAAMPASTSTVRCDTKNCPSRLEFYGDLTEVQAAEAARARKWHVIAGVLHHCPSCKKDGT
jgi:hypothetical protein